MIDLLLRDKNLWSTAIDKAVEKGINKELLRKISNTGIIERIIECLENGTYEFEQPEKKLVPKDNGQFRTVFVNSDLDRVILNLLSEVLSVVYGNQVSENVYSYKKGSCVSKVLKKVLIENKGEWSGYKLDVVGYFDNIRREDLEKCASQLSLGRGIDYCIKSYLFEDLEDGTYKSLGQGSALSAFYSNWILKDIDEGVASLFGVNYYRYADDILIIGERAKEAVFWVVERLSKLGLIINLEKSRWITSTEPFKYLGFVIDNDTIRPGDKAFKLIKRSVGSLGIKKGSLDLLATSIRKLNNILYGKNGQLLFLLNGVSGKEQLLEIDLYLKNCIRRKITRRNNDYHNNRVLPNEFLQSLGYLSMTSVWDYYRIDEHCLEVLVRENKNPVWAAIAEYGDTNCYHDLMEMVRKGASTKFFLKERIILVDGKRYDWEGKELLPTLEGCTSTMLLDLYDDYVHSYGICRTSNFPAKSYWEVDDMAIIKNDRCVRSVAFEAFLFFGIIEGLFDIEWGKDFVKVLTSTLGNKLVLKRDWFD